jgi:hypothetical protein
LATWAFVRPVGAFFAGVAFFPGLGFGVGWWAAGFATFANKTWTASQMRATATLRSVNFFNGLSVLSGATPAKLFQISTGRLGGPGGDQLGQFLGRAEILGVVNLGGSRLI